MNPLSAGKTHIVISYEVTLQFHLVL